MTVYVVRHGRTEANAGGLLLGRADPELDAQGRDQARRLAAAVPAGVAVVTSPLRRCAQTAVAIAGDGEVHPDERFLELDYGEWDLTPVTDVPAESWAAWRADRHFRPPGGETLAELAGRVSAGIEDWVDRTGGQDLVVVTHVSPIKAVVAWALGVGIEVSWRTFVAPASITRIAMSERGPSLHGFNDVAHLGP
jgi:broad specificity phosphatase PhoE